MTLRTDPTWGVSETLPTPRTQAPIYSQNFYSVDNTRINNKDRMKLHTDYDRCKTNRRCNWAEAGKRENKTMTNININIKSTRI